MVEILYCDEFNGFSPNGEPNGISIANETGALDRATTPLGGLSAPQEKLVGQDDASTPTNLESVSAFDTAMPAGHPQPSSAVSERLDCPECGRTFTVTAASGRQGGNLAAKLAAHRRRSHAVRGTSAATLRRNSVKRFAGMHIRF